MRCRRGCYASTASRSRASSLSSTSSAPRRESRSASSSSSSSSRWALGWAAVTCSVAVIEARASASARSQSKTSSSTLTRRAPSVTGRARSRNRLSTRPCSALRNHGPRGSSRVGARNSSQTARDAGKANPPAWVRSARRRAIDHTVGRLLHLVGIAPRERLVRRWEGARATLTIGEDRE